MDHPNPEPAPSNDLITVSISGLRREPSTIVLQGHALIVMMQLDDRGNDVASVAQGREPQLFAMIASLIELTREKYGESKVQAILRASRVKASQVTDVTHPKRG